jgi:hypothetical protein
MVFAEAGLNLRAVNRISADALRLPAMKVSVTMPEMTESDGVHQLS